MCPFSSLLYARNLYITAAGHYVRRLLTHFTVRIGPGGRRTAAASHLSCCAVGLVILPYFRLCNLLLVFLNASTMCFDRRRGELRGLIPWYIRVRGLMEACRGSIARSQGRQTLASKFNFSTPKARSMTPCELLQIRHPLPPCVRSSACSRALRPAMTI